MRYFLLFVLLSLSMLSSSTSNENHSENEGKTVLIINGIINKENMTELQGYLNNVMQVFKENGGRPIAKYKTIEELSGEDSPEMMAIIEFPDAKAIKNMISGDGFTALSEQRAQVFSKLNMMICNGD